MSDPIVILKPIVYVAPMPSNMFSDNEQWKVSLKNPLKPNVSHSFIFNSEEVARNYAEYLDREATELAKRRAWDELHWDTVVSEVNRMKGDL